MRIIDMVITRNSFLVDNNKKRIFPAAGIGTSLGFHTPCQPSRKDESTPRGRFLNFTLWV
jgi:hypothetical protein